MTTYNKREIQKILRKNGWYLDHYSGGHAIYRKYGVAEPIVIGLNHCNKMILQRLIKQHKIAV